VSYRTPISNCASAEPFSAAIRYQRNASAKSPRSAAAAPRAVAASAATVGADVASARASAVAGNSAASAMIGKAIRKLLARGREGAVMAIVSELLRRAER
jgi:hypothetical protein